MIEVPVSQNHSVEPPTFKFRIATVLRFLFLTALKHTAVNQNARVFGNYVVCRAGYVTSCAVKMNLHGPSSVRTPLTCFASKTREACVRRSTPEACIP